MEGDVDDAADGRGIEKVELEGGEVPQNVRVELGVWDVERGCNARQHLEHTDQDARFDH